MSIFDDRISQPDFYLQHMKDTMDWIERKMREAEEEAAKDPSLRKRGYGVGIYVEGRWLKQLIAENAQMHQRLIAMESRIADGYVAGLNLMPTMAISKPEEK